MEALSRAGNAHLSSTTETHALPILSHQRAFNTISDLISEIRNIWSFKRPELAELYAPDHFMLRQFDCCRFGTRQHTFELRVCFDRSVENRAMGTGLML
jgi:hypothetical protein